MRYAAPELYSITDAPAAGGACADGNATAMTPSCQSGPEAVGMGGCANGAAAESACKTGAAAGPTCEAGAGVAHTPAPRRHRRW